MTCYTGRSDSKLGPSGIASKENEPAAATLNPAKFQEFTPQGYELNTPVSCVTYDRVPEFTQG